MIINFYNNFTLKPLSSLKHMFFTFSYAIQFDGIPFMVVNVKALDCQHGVDRNIKLKQNLKEKREEEMVFFRKNLIKMK